MGVKDVWHIAGPCEERISLHSLRGSTLAVDLAGWVVSGNTAPGLANHVKRPHLRNLFFRINSLLSLDILPVVVLDGVCPDIKKATVAARNQAVWGPGSNTHMSPKRQQRNQFKGVLADCNRMLESLGVPCLVAPGEAEVSQGQSLPVLTDLLSPHRRTVLRSTELVLWTPWCPMTATPSATEPRPS